MNKLPVAIGIDDYLSAKTKYYVDKTKIIEDLIEQALGGTVLITRPRRFGKSLTLSTLEYFFTNENDYSAAFANTNIAKNKRICEEYQNKYPVIHFNLKDISGDNADEIIAAVTDQVSLLYRRFAFLSTSERLLPIEREEFTQIMEKRADSILLRSCLRRLSGFLSKHFNSKVILLIDEYDCPVERAYERGCYSECMSFIKPIYSSALKGNGDLLFAVVTGVLQIAKESVFSGLNNLLVASTNDRFLNQYFGFSEEETKEALEYYGHGVELETVRRWYGGYNLAVGQEMFNPWSIMSFISNGVADTYWVNTGSNELLRMIFSDYPVGERVFSLVGTHYPTIQFAKEINYNNIADNDESLISFLLQTGYLTFQRKGSDFALAIPNQEIRDLFRYEILNVNPSRSGYNRAASLMHALKQGDEKAVEDALQKYVLDCFSYYDLKEEKDYQITLTSLLGVLFETHVVRSEVNAGQGRCDILISPKKPNQAGYLFELKHSKAKREPSASNLKKIADSALRQIQEKQYFVELEERGAHLIHCYGIAFCKKNSAVSYKTLDLSGK